MTDDVHALLDARGRTSFWSDSPDMATYRSTRFGLRSLIGSPIYIGNQTHFITFSLIDGLTDEPFVETDIAFVDVVASNVSHRFHQRSQLERLQYQIEHDSLTALYNRTQFLRLGRTKATDGSLFGIITINIDRFRLFNERDGQMIGDELLVEIAARLRHVEERDVVARLGGDDFAVLLVSDIGETLEHRLEQYEVAFRQPFHTGDRNGKVFLSVTASLGAAAFGPGTRRFDEVLSNANVALDAAKAAGGAVATAFGPQLQNSAVERALEGNEIRAALQRNEFVLEYQPTVEMVTRSIVSAEALVRWQHPKRGRLAPSAFLGAVKRANLLGELTAWVMRRLARDLEGSALPSGIRVYFNVPAQVLETESFLGQLESLLDDHPMLTNRLGVEITESEVMNRVELAITTLQSIRRLGIRVAIDDFGTGYSSLSYLKRLPIDVVKLDKSFIDGLPDDESDIALANLFLALTKQFNFISVAEGVETERQAVWLQEHGCMIAQGYLFSRPVPLDDFIALVGQSRVLV
jgi:diguanylate cyclase (GGDEF)-like protein